MKVGKREGMGYMASSYVLVWGKGPRGRGGRRPGVQEELRVREAD